MKNSDYNYGLYIQEPCHKRVLNGIKKKPIIFGLISFAVVATLVIIIVSISVSKNKGKKGGDENKNEIIPEQKGREKSIEPKKEESIEIEEEESTEDGEIDICSNRYSDECLYEKMIAKKQEYPEGTPWTNANYYAWKGGVYSGGYGCAGFAFMLSDVCFDNIKAQNLNPCPSTFKVGDVVRINNDTHFVIILKIDKSTSTIIIAEGNFNSSVHWGRQFTFQSMKNTCNYVLRRNPN